MTKVERHENDVLLWDGIGSAPLILSKEEAVDTAQALLDAAGKITTVEIGEVEI